MSLPINPAEAIRISLEAIAFISRVAPSLVELWHAHDQKDDVVLQAIDMALVLKRAANDRALEEKHKNKRLGDVAEKMGARDDEKTSEVPLPDPKPR